MDLNKNIKPILAILVVVFAFSYFFYCSLAVVKPDPQILIAVVGATGTVLGYWFGSSSGSSKKDEIIGDATNKPVVNTADTVNA